MARVVHFEIYTDDPEAVRPFYENVFGWKIEKWNGPVEYWVATTGPDGQPGINGGFLRPRQGQSAGTLNTIAVESLDDALSKIEEQGGNVCVPKMAVPTIGWLAYAQDPAGNVFGVLEPDADAK
jgi:predicted enzyme related to lactoylglutathione lyase